MAAGRALGLVMALAMTLAACSDPNAPKGRWEGFSESANWLLAVRLQVDAGNVIHATALSVEVDGVSLPKRVELTRRIKATMLEQWPDAVRGRVDYENNTITKAGGYAPLFVYDPRSGSMTFYFYAHGKLTEKIKLYPVKKFAEA